MIGLLRVKNEARWIERCVRSILPVCESVLVMDDHSTDGTPDICAAIPGVKVLHSPFEGLDETRDKNWLLYHVRDADMVLIIDGDEMLDPSGLESVRNASTSSCPKCQAFSFPILYLWDSEGQIRTDGVYGRFRRTSMFRPGGQRFESAAGGGFHCGNVPRALQHDAHPLQAPLLHFGYLHREDRIRKYHWYNGNDPGNASEDGYRHMVQGDIPGISAEAKLMHGGPLRLEALCSRISA